MLLVLGVSVIVKIIAIACIKFGSNLIIMLNNIKTIRPDNCSVYNIIIIVCYVYSFSNGGGELLTITDRDWSNILKAIV